MSEREKNDVVVKVFLHNSKWTCPIMNDIASD